jgi:hypothetical protein
MIPHPLHIFCYLFACECVILWPNERVYASLQREQALIALAVIILSKFQESSWLLRYEKYRVFPVTGRGEPLGCEALRLPHFLDSRLTYKGEDFSFTHLPPPPLHPGRFLVLLYVRGWVDSKATVRLKGLDRLKNQLPCRESNLRYSSL